MDLSHSRKIQIAVSDQKIASADIKVDKFLIIAVGEAPPDFEAATLDGKKIKLSELKGKVVFIDFWATWCAPCVAEMPNIREVYDKYAADGDFVVIGVSVDDDASMVRNFVKAKKIPWPQIAGGAASVNPIAKKYNVTGVPVTYLIGRDGKVIAKDIKGWKLKQKLADLFAKPEAVAAGK